MQNYKNNESGSLTVLFSLSLMALLSVVGLAVDYGRATSLYRELQHAVDAAVLAGANPTIPLDQRESAFENALKAHYENSNPISRSSFTFNQNNGAAGSATVNLPNVFMTLIGLATTEVKVDSKAVYDNTSVEIVFAIDVSGSMRLTRLESVKAAAAKLISTLSQGGASAKFSLVPFNMAINIGTSNASLVSGTNNPLFAESGWGGCVLERPNGFHHKDNYGAGASDGTGKWPAYVWPPEPNSGSYCNNPSNGTNSGYQVPEGWPLTPSVLVNGPNYNCPRYPLVDLTPDGNAVNASIQNLTAESNFGTTIGPAVSWAMRILSPGQPFTQGAPYSKSVRKIIVVLTDGDQVVDAGSCSSQTNTITPFEFDPTSIGLQGRKLSTYGPTNSSFTPYGYLVDSDPYNQGITTRSEADRELDRLTLQACTEAKSQGTGRRPIEIFSIAAGADAGPGTRAYDVLSACASTAGHMYHAASESDMESVFKAIGEKAITLRLTN